MVGKKRQEKSLLLLRLNGAKGSENCRVVEEGNGRIGKRRSDVSLESASNAGRRTLQLATKARLERLQRESVHVDENWQQKSEKKEKAEVQPTDANVNTLKCQSDRRTNEEKYKVVGEEEEEGGELYSKSGANTGQTTLDLPKQIMPHRSLLPRNNC